MPYIKKGGHRGLEQAGRTGYSKSMQQWRKLIAEALVARNIYPTQTLYDIIIDRVFTNNHSTGGDIGWSTIDSYVGLLQAKGKLPGADKYHGPLHHFDKVRLSERSDVKRFEGFGEKESSSKGLRVVKSRFGWG